MKILYNIYLAWVQSMKGVNALKFYFGLWSVLLFGCATYKQRVNMRRWDIENQRKFFDNPCEAYKAMWANSLKNGDIYKECISLITEKGVLILPMQDNTDSSSTVGNYMLGAKPNWFIQYLGKLIRINAVIHTHPGSNHINGFSRGDVAFAKQVGVPVYIIEQIGSQVRKGWWEDYIWYDNKVLTIEELLNCDPLP